MRKIFKHIGLICLALALAIGSFFVPIRKPNRSQMASADTSTSSSLFNSSNIFIPVTATPYGNNSECAFYLLDFEFSISNYSASDFYLTLNSHMSYISASSSPRFDTYKLYSNQSDNSTSSVIINPSYGQGSYFDSDSHGRIVMRTHTFYTYGPTGWGYSFQLGFNIDSSFNCNVNVIHFGSYSGSTGILNFIEYIDNNENKLTFYFYLSSSFRGNYFGSSIEQLQFTDRFYYTDLNFSDNQLYQQGYLEGLADNQQNIYDNGYNTGYDDGKSVGKTEGIAEANDYSFISLFGGLFDAPVAMLIGLLNFEFLGINLWAFVTALFTFALVLFIVKLIMGR